MEREPITRVWGRSPQRGPEAEPLVGGSGERSPPEAETLFASECSMETANSPIFLKFGNAKDHQTLLDFAILAGKWQKRIFSYKVACKKISWSGQGGHRTVTPPKYATVGQLVKLVSSNYYPKRVAADAAVLVMAVMAVHQLLRASTNVVNGAPRRVQCYEWWIYPTTSARARILWTSPGRCQEDVLK